MVSLVRVTVSPWIGSLHGANLYRFSVNTMMWMGLRMSDPSESFGESVFA